MTDKSANTNNRPAASSAAAPASTGFSIGGLFRHPAVGAFMGMVLVFIFFSIFGYDRNFLTAFGTSSWVNAASTIGIIAIPIGFLMIAGELDISIGAVVPAAKMAMAISVGYYGLPFVAGLLITFAIAGAIGWVNGSIVTRTNVPSLIVTLATLFAVSGLTLFLSLRHEGNLFDVAFEVVSAFANAGYSLNFTGNLDSVGRYVIAFAMFWGRLGPLTIVVALAQRQQPTLIHYPEEPVILG